MPIINILEHSRRFIDNENCWQGINSNMKYKNTETVLTFLFPDKKTWKLKRI